MKVCQLEIYGRALKSRGIDVPMIEMEKQGIPAVCKAHGIDPASLGLKGALLAFRRRKQDMPLAQASAKEPDELENAYAAREKLLSISQGKFLFRFQDRTMPLELVNCKGWIEKSSEDDRWRSAAYGEVCEGDRRRRICPGCCLCCGRGQVFDLLKRLEETYALYW